jgi:hypothetical protein
MIMDRHEWVLARLSDYLEGHLSGPDEAHVEDHLEACESCRDVLGGLSEVRELARTLGPLEPPRDLWPDIEAARERRFGHRRWTFSVPQLAAAAVVLMTVSASSAWWALGGAGPVPSGPAAVPIPPVSAVATGRTDTPISEELAAELGMLEGVLATGHDRLDPHTLHVLERNLLVIERAIEDSYRALALDPGNDFVRAHLERTYERKLEYLRDVSRIVESAG